MFQKLLYVIVNLLLLILPGLHWGSSDAQFVGCRFIGAARTGCVSVWRRSAARGSLRGVCARPWHYSTTPIRHHLSTYGGSRSIASLTLETKALIRHPRNSAIQSVWTARIREYTLLRRWLLNIGQWLWPIPGDRDGSKSVEDARPARCVCSLAGGKMLL